MKILAFAASNSQQSINRALINYAINRLQSDLLPKAEIETLDIHEYEMPIYSIDREQADGIPSPAHALYERIGKADALIVSFAEHNGYTSAAWKNIFDWMSRIDVKVWQGKPMVMLAASPGGRGGQNVLSAQENAAPRFGAEILAMQGIGRWSEAWDAAQQTLTKPEDRAAIDKALSALQD